MSEIFISYKREDETRVARLVHALRKSNLTVFWDQLLAPGENYRTQIHQALAAARCVIVVWTNDSVGPAGDFVRDEASEAKRRNLLVPVRLDPVDPPHGFGEIQSLDLTHWKGSPRDPFFQDLLATIKAKLEQRPVPPPQGPVKRLTRRLTWAALASALPLTALGFGLNFLRVQDRLCAAPPLQPSLSDVCGSLGLGDRPTKTERLAWASLQPGSCAALKSHLEHFPRGAYHDEAASLLNARRVSQTDVWEPATHTLSVFEPQSDVPSPDPESARSAAIARSQSLATRLCGDFAVTASFHFKSATLVPRKWDCVPLAGGITCGFDGEVSCALDERRIWEAETCGNPAPSRN